MEYKDFVSDLKDDKVTSVIISQNAEVPTGTLTITFSDGSKDSLNVSDVVSVQELLDNRELSILLRMLRETVSG